MTTTVKDLMQQAVELVDPAALAAEMENDRWVALYNAVDKKGNWRTKKLTAGEAITQLLIHIVQCGWWPETGAKVEPDVREDARQLLLSAGIDADKVHQMSLGTLFESKGGL